MSSSSYSLYPSSSEAAAAAGEVPTGMDCSANWECEEDPMVKIELEAAEALAGLAHFMMPESGTRYWNECEGPSQRVKTESPARDSRTNPEASDQAGVVQQQGENICSVTMKKVQVEQDTELPKPSPMCTSSYGSFSGNKSKQSLTEEEKEARRIRRVLANRESARQTIRRRQALYEELTRKATSLAWENENLKREKELAVKEYDSLKSTNKNLKAQMSKAMEAEIEETRVDSKSTNVEISTSLCTNYPFRLYNQSSFTPFLWPASIQSSNPLQLQNGFQNANIVPSKFSMPAIAKPDPFQGQENPLKISGSGTPLYILPCPWFFPFTDNGNGLHLRPSFDLNDEQNETSMNNQCSASSSSKTIVAHAEKHHPSLPIKVETEASSSTEAMPANDLHGNPFRFPPDGDGLPTGVVMPAPLKSVRPTSTVKHETDRQSNIQAFPSSVSHVANALPELKQDLIVSPSKQVDTLVAAEARKRRKELTKLKSLRCRKLWMH